MGAWVKQIASQIAKYGKENASWYCEWNEPNGGRRCKSCGAGSRGKKLAEQMAKHVRAEILTGTYSRTAGVKWKDFRKRYDTNVVSGMSLLSRETVFKSLKHFESILKLGEKSIAAITPDRLADFVAARRKMAGKKKGTLASPATINRDLRQIKAALRVACEWGYIDKVPKIHFEREPKTLPRYVTPEHFGAIYTGCKRATIPSDLNVEPVAWWRGLIVMGQMTGWRISELLALEWKDVELDAGTAVTRASDNKGKRDDIVALHPIVVDHLRSLKTFHPNVFPWNGTRKQLLDQFHAIQAAAGVSVACKDQRKHECTDACCRYGFHDLRRAFATMNAANMTREALQALMRHRSSLTTERYINFARQMSPAVANLHVPEVLKMNAVS